MAIWAWSGQSQSSELRSGWTGLTSMQAISWTTGRDQLSSSLSSTISSCGHGTPLIELKPMPNELTSSLVVEGVDKRGYAQLPPVEEAIAAHLCPSH